ncbi:hypothetical protein ACTMU2_32165 [Cupriavidus basilensis]
MVDAVARAALRLRDRADHHVAGTALGGQGSRPGMASAGLAMRTSTCRCARTAAGFIVAMFGPRHSALPSSGTSGGWRLPDLPA